MKRKTVKRMVIALIWTGILFLIGAMGLWENSACSDNEFYVRTAIGMAIILSGLIAGYINATLQRRRYMKSLKYRRAIEKIQAMKKSA